MKYRRTSKALSIVGNISIIIRKTASVDTTMKPVLSCLLVTSYHGALTRFDSKLYKLESCSMQFYLWYFLLALLFYVTFMGFAISRRVSKTKFVFNG